MFDRHDTIDTQPASLADVILTASDILNKNVNSYSWTRIERTIKKTNSNNSSPTTMIRQNAIRG